MSGRLIVSATRERIFIAPSVRARIAYGSYHKQVCSPADSKPSEIKVPDRYETQVREQSSAQNDLLSRVI